MFSLSEASENSLKKGILQLISDFLKSYQKPKPRVLGLISAPELREELGIKEKTLQRWERAGLKRYTPPIEETRKVFYKVSDVLVFLGVDKEN